MNTKKQAIYNLLFACCLELEDEGADPDVKRIAVELAEKAAGLLDNPLSDRIYVMKMPGIYIRSGKREKAQKLLAEALKALRNEPSRDKVSEICLYAAAAYIELGQIEKAMEALLMTCPKSKSISAKTLARLYDGIITAAIQAREVTPTGRRNRENES